MEALTSFEVQIIPFLIGVLLIQLPIFIRRRYNFWYGPVYFSFFPLSQLNSNLSEYFAEDFFVGNLEQLTEAQEKNLKKKIQYLGIKSLSAATILSPIFSVLLSVWFLRVQDMYWVLLAAFLLKLPGMIRSVGDFKLHAIATKKNLFLLSLLYFCYFGVYFEVYRTTFFWIKPFVETSNYFGLLSSLSQFIFRDLLVTVLIIGAITAFFINNILDKDVRERNIKALREENKPSD